MRSGNLPAAFFCLAYLGAAAAAEPDLTGVWVLGGRAVERELVMTDQARAIQSEYDLLNDDPSLKCVPASLSRVWANPNSRFKIEQAPAELQISYELFDLRRRIPVGDASALSDSPSTQNLDGRQFNEMGSSFAWYEGDRLFIETRNHAPGYIRTSRGIPQSATTIATEEFWRDGDVLKMTLTYVDDTLFEVPFVIDHEFERIEDAEILPYNCEGADYDWFEQLNKPGEGQ